MVKYQNIGVKMVLYDTTQSYTLISFIVSYILYISIQNVDPWITLAMVLSTHQLVQQKEVQPYTHATMGICWKAMLL